MSHDLQDAINALGAEASSNDQQRIEALARLLAAVSEPTRESRHYREGRLAGVRAAIQAAGFMQEVETELYLLEGGPEE